MFNPLRKIRELTALSQRLSSTSLGVGTAAVLSVSSSDSGSLQLPESVSTIVYVAMFTNFVLWTWYGAASPNFIVFVQNGLGLLLTIYYIRKWQQLSLSSVPGAGTSLVSLYPAWLSAPRRVNGVMLVASLFASMLGLLTLQKFMSISSLGAVCVSVRLKCPLFDGSSL